MIASYFRLRKLAAFLDVPCHWWESNPSLRARVHAKILAVEALPAKPKMKRPDFRRAS